MLSFSTADVGRERGELHKRETAPMFNMEPWFVECRATYELTMNIATNGDWTPDRLYVRFLHQDFPSLCTQ